jgi:hypothetical protein
MADVSITAGNVLAGTGSTTRGTAGATLTAGQPVYLDASVARYKAANALTASSAVVAGITLNGGSNGQPMEIIQSGILTAGGTLAVGKTYILSSNSGGICPVDDESTNHYISVLGVATSSSLLKMNPIISGVKLA